MNCTREDHDYFPQYGLAPHRHNFSKTGGSFIGSSEIIPSAEWPKNFVEDRESPGCGIYYCPGCLEGKP